MEVNSIELDDPLFGDDPRVIAPSINLSKELLHDKYSADVIHSVLFI